MKKRVFIVFLCGILMLSIFSGCAKNKKTSATNKSISDTQASETATAASVSDKTTAASEITTAKAIATTTKKASDVNKSRSTTNAKKASSKTTAKSKKVDSKHISMTAKEIAYRFEAAGLPITDISVDTSYKYPKGTVSIATFRDTIAKGDPNYHGDFDSINWAFGSVETYESEEYVQEAIATKDSLKFGSGYYYYVNANCLLCLQKEISPANAAKYEKIFSQIK